MAMSGYWRNTPFHVYVAFSVPFSSTAGPSGFRPSRVSTSSIERRSPSALPRSVLSLPTAALDRRLALHSRAATVEIATSRPTPTAFRAGETFVFRLGSERSPIEPSSCLVITMPLFHLDGDTDRERP